MVSQYPRGRSRPAHRSLALAALLPLAVSTPAAGKGMLQTCTDAAWADYNSCLVDSSTWWMRTGCDIAFSADYTLCWAKYIGEVQTAVM